MLLLDVESGSVGSALLRLSGTEQPKLFGESRVATPVLQTLSGAQLAAAVEQAATEALYRASEVAARVRNHPNTASFGAIEHASIFLSPPWGKPNLAAGKPDFVDAMTGAMRKGVEAVFGAIKTTFHTAAGAVSHIGRTLGTEPLVLCVVTGEVTELLLIDKQGVRAHATIPTGVHDVLRTLRTHAGLSEPEARSALHLPFATGRVKDPFRAAAAHFGEQFRDASAELLQYSDAPVARVHVIAQEPAGDWFARALSSHEPLSLLYPHGEVRALRSNHLTPHVAAHAARPDLFLLLGALFVDSTSDTQLK